MKIRSLLVFAATVLAGCTAKVPDDLARAVLMQELPVVEGVATEGFLACVGIESRDADAETLAMLRDARIAALTLLSGNV
jgi:hypothetical protein